MKLSMLLLFTCRIKHVEKATEVNAVETLMVTDELFRLEEKLCKR